MILLTDKNILIIPHNSSAMSSINRFLGFYAANFAALLPLTKGEVLRLYLSTSQTAIEFAEFAEVFQLDLDAVKVYVTVGLAQLQKQKEEQDRLATVEEEKSE